MSLAGSEELDQVTGPALAGFIADDLKMNSRWQVMDQSVLEKLKAGEWLLTHETSEWRTWREETSPEEVVHSTNIDLNL